MIDWTTAPREERNLLNPSFVSVIMWHAAIGYRENSQTSLPFELSFLILSMVLHEELRDSLPVRHSTSFAVWLESNAKARILISERTKILVPYSREGLIFGESYNYFRVGIRGIEPNPDFKTPTTKLVNISSEEVKRIYKKAQFVGAWFALTGSSQTIFAMIGVKP